MYRIFGEPTRLVEHQGYICDFEKKKGYYKVKYQDGDTEEYEEKEIETMLHKTKQNTNILRALAATKHEQIIEEYAKMESIYTPPSQFSGGYLKAMECIEMMALEAINTGFGTVGQQDYKWANIMIDEETVDVVNLKKLLRHPKYTETWTRAAANEYSRLFQGCGRNKDGSQQIEGTKACRWIKKSQVPKGKTATYNRSVTDTRPEKVEPNQV